MAHMRGLWLYLRVSFLVMLSAVAISNPAAAQTVELKPVMIIRFNQPNVDYQQQLAMVIARARSVKPGVVFDLIQYIPPTESRSRLAEFSRNKDQLLVALKSNGVSQAQTRFMQNKTPDVPTDEVYIFVR